MFLGPRVCRCGLYDQHHGVLEILKHLKFDLGVWLIISTPKRQIPYQGSKLHPWGEMPPPGLFSYSGTASSGPNLRTVS